MCYFLSSFQNIYISVDADCIEIKVFLTSYDDEKGLVKIGHPVIKPNKTLCGGESNQHSNRCHINHQQLYNEGYNQKYACNSVNGELLR